MKPNGLEIAGSYHLLLTRIGDTWSIRNINIHLNFPDIMAIEPGAEYYNLATNLIDRFLSVE